MSNEDLANIATTLMADGKGILAADETVGTLTNGSTRSGSGPPSRAGARTERCSLPPRVQPNSSAA